MLGKNMEGVNNLIATLRNRHMGISGHNLPRIRDALNILLYRKLDSFQLDIDDLWDWIYDDIADLVENTVKGKPLVNPIPDVWYGGTTLHYYKDNAGWSICGRSVMPAGFLRRTRGTTSDKLNPMFHVDRCKYCVSMLEKEPSKEK